MQSISTFLLNTKSFWILMIPIFSKCGMTIIAINTTYLFAFGLLLWFMRRPVLFFMIFFMIHILNLFFFFYGFSQYLRVLFFVMTDDDDDYFFKSLIRWTGLEVLTDTHTKNLSNLAFGYASVACQMRTTDLFFWAHKKKFYWGNITKKKVTSTKQGRNFIVDVMKN